MFSSLDFPSVYTDKILFFPYTTWQHRANRLLNHKSNANVRAHRDVQPSARSLQRHAELLLLEKMCWEKKIRINITEIKGNGKERKTKLWAQQWQQKIDYHNLFTIRLNCFLHLILSTLISCSSFNKIKYIWDWIKGDALVDIYTILLEQKLLDGFTRRMKHFKKADEEFSWMIEILSFLNH